MESNVSTLSLHSLANFCWKFQPHRMKNLIRYFSTLVLFPFFLSGQNPPYDIFPKAEPPYYQVRYEASGNTKGLQFPVKYTIWIPEGVKSLRGVIVHQHGCGEGSCKSGLTGAWDLHWQALAENNNVRYLLLLTSNHKMQIVNYGAIQGMVQVGLSSAPYGIWEKPAVILN